MTNISALCEQLEQLLIADQRADVLGEALTSIYQSTISLTSSVYGANSAQSRHLLTVGELVDGNDYARRSASRVIRGTLQAVRRDVESGLIGSIELRGSGTSLADMLTLAREALANTTDGTDRVAAVLSAAAFEDTIRRMGETLAGVEGRPKLQKVIDALKKQDLLTGPSATLVQGHLQFRNNALHVNRDAVQQGSHGRMHHVC